MQRTGCRGACREMQFAAMRRPPRSALFRPLPLFRLSHLLIYLPSCLFIYLFICLVVYLFIYFPPQKGLRVWCAARRAGYRLESSRLRKQHVVPRDPTRNNTLLAVEGKSVLYCLNKCLIELQAPRVMFCSLPGVARTPSSTHSPTAPTAGPAPPFFEVLLPCESKKL